MRPAKPTGRYTGKGGDRLPRYSIGLDYGTLSVRALLLNLDTGEEAGVEEYLYPHGVMDRLLPADCTGSEPIPLGHEWALQHPQDYLDALGTLIPALLRNAGAQPEEVAGIGLDFTSCTILPTTTDGSPLCLTEPFRREPHAYVKLWKHHAAQYCADRLNDVASRRREPFLARYGGRISSEWLVPKAMQIAIEAPEIYHAAGRIIEAGDWVVWQLCGREVRSACNAGYKALWHHTDGYPSEDFFRELAPEMEHFVREKLDAPIAPLGSMAGRLTKQAAKLTGLKEGTPVAVGIIDAHASVPGSAIGNPGTMLLILGTSTCHMLLSRDEQPVEGACGVVKDGILPGFFGYEAGQSCVGDHFSWFVQNSMPGWAMDEANKTGLSPHEWLSQKAAGLSPGESGLIALDWFNGVRSVLMDFDLSGLIVGMTLQTKPWEIYRALIEATAFGTRRIIEAFESQGIPVEALCAAGGIAHKNPLLMQIYADVCGREIRLTGSRQSGALGSAILGAAAAEKEPTDDSDLCGAAARLGRLDNGTAYRPDPGRTAAYDHLYAQYLALHDLFGRKISVMKDLKRMRVKASEPSRKNN